MAAEAIGFDLGRPLLVVNTLNVISQGNNIDKLFENAKKKEALLVFDKAEVLFGSRSEKNTSSEQTADLLLQNIENFNGICIVIAQVVEKAFLRHFSYVVEFESPDAQSREMIWKSTLPKGCPIKKDVDLNVLARRYDMSGGDIKNALFCAATQASLRPVEVERIISMKDLTAACLKQVGKKRDKEVEGMYS